jgi:hypothetical protein
MSGKMNKKRKLERVNGPGDSGAIAKATVTDPRFANIQTDPRYRLPGRQHKVKLDSRFTKALKDDDFVRKAKVDRYGRPLQTDSERQRLKRKFDLEDATSEESDEADDDELVRKELHKFKPDRDLLREGHYTDSSASSSSDDDDESDSDLEEAELTLQTQSNVPTGQVSSRLAVVNLDWDNIRAQDLMAVFSSFTESSSLLKHVAIYPSEFGKERLQREEMEGPPKEIFANAKSQKGKIEVSEDEQDEETIKSSLLKPESDVDFDSTALRNYQLQRLRYFYAVLSFSNPVVAKAVYDSVDGTEYLSTANFFDLRFVPDETDFSTDIPREECSSIPTDYKPNEFVTDALRHTKVKLTWDAEDATRKEAQARAFRGSRKDIDENDLKAYLGSDSSSSEEEEEADSLLPVDDNASTITTSKKEEHRNKMRALLGLAPEMEIKPSRKSKEKPPVGNVQVTFSAGLSSGNIEGKKGVFVNTEEEAMETTLEKYVRKEKERKARRRDKAKASRAGQADDEDEDAEAGADQTPVATAADANEDGFDDPFFTEPSSSKSQSASKKLRKEERLKLRKEREEKEERQKKERAQLEKLMTEDINATGSENKAGAGMQHFDMREIERAEKMERKKAKRVKSKNKLKMREGEDGGQVDEFNVDTEDPRFAKRLFENHEFAIDPTNPRFKETKGMKALLEEGRKRKDRVGNNSVKSGNEKKGAAEVDGDLRALAEKLNKKKHTA